MTAMNIVRCRVKEGKEDAFLAMIHERAAEDPYPGQKSFSVVNTGDREYFFVGEWEGMDAIVQSRPAMVNTLDKLRDLLEDLGGDLGVTDPRSGEVVSSS